MDPLTIALIALRGMSALFNLAGESDKGTLLSTLADGAEAGVNVDAHMQAVAVALKSGAPKDWADAANRINTDSDLLQGKTPAPV